MPKAGARTGFIGFNGFRQKFTTPDRRVVSMVKPVYHTMRDDNFYCARKEWGRSDNVLIIADHFPGRSKWNAVFTEDRTITVWWFCEETGMFYSFGAFKQDWEELKLLFRERIMSVATELTIYRRFDELERANGETPWSDVRNIARTLKCYVPGSMDTDESSDDEESV